MRDFIAKEGRLTEKERRNLSILDSIRRGGEISRAEISKQTDLNIVTVSNYVSKYIKQKLVFETGLDISSGGRRPELLKLNRQAGYSIGIDLGTPQLTPGSSVTGVIMDLSGEIVAEEKIEKERESFDRLADKVVEMTDLLIRKSGVSLPAVKGIGVGIWGVIDRYRGMVRYAVEDEQIVSYMNLLNQLESRFDLPTLIEHDATLAAFGERWSGIGAGSTAENLVFMCSDSSCGLVIKGDLYYGSTKSAGELNLNPPPEGASSGPCWSGYEYGCCLRSRGIDLGITSFVRGKLQEDPSLSAALTESAGGDISALTLEMIIEACEKGDSLSRMAVDQAGEYLGTKIAFLINLFNPEVIVIGRGIEKAGDHFLSAVRKSVRKWGYEESVKVVKILPTSLGDNVVARGAGGLVVQKFFAGV